VRCPPPAATHRAQDTLAHLVEEETQVLPLVERGLSAEAKVQLGLQYMAAAARAPHKWVAAAAGR
jgi:hypothetical protein